MKLGRSFEWYKANNNHPLQTPNDIANKKKLAWYFAICETGCVFEFLIAIHIYWY